MLSFKLLISIKNTKWKHLPIIFKTMIKITMRDNLIFNRITFSLKRMIVKQAMHLISHHCHQTKKEIWGMLNIFERRCRDFL